jgi:hypothetical protein
MRMKDGLWSLIKTKRRKKHAQKTNIIIIKNLNGEKGN